MTKQENIFATLLRTGCELKNLKFESQNIISFDEINSTDLINLRNSSVYFNNCVFRLKDRKQYILILEQI